MSRAAALLVFSYLFYSGGEPVFVLILLLSSATDFVVAQRVHGAAHMFVRRAWLSVSIAVNLSILGIFKYGAWALPGVASVLGYLGLPLPDPDYFKGYVLPAGISFYTFQSLAYTVDVYRGRIAPERSLLGFCNFVAYLPQLIAGPIERFADLHPQIQKFVQGRAQVHFTAGIDRILLGLVQKLIIADSCGMIVDKLLAAGGSYDLVTAWSIALAFGMQIYYDFAAYTHMAIGISLLLGIRLNENFNSPYLAVSIQDFWRRWHITLSSWFRDYVYIPLGGSRQGLARTFLNILLTFLLVGLWHGAGWNFVAWGAGHGLLLGLYRLKQHYWPRWILPAPAGVALTFVLVQFLWVPFRVGDTLHIVQIWAGMLGMNGIGAGLWSIADLVFLSLVIAGTLVVPNAGRRWPGRAGWQESAALAAIAAFAVLSTPQITKFIYFQF
jgi:alginate O-acetyltransferase complex protein AlgI